MKNKTLLVLLIIAALLITVPTALAQGPTGGVSGIQVVNIDTSSATLSAVYYAEDGTPYTLADQTLAGQGDSYTYYAEPASASTFSGAAIVSSDKNIAAIVNTAFSSNGAGAAYDGFSAGATNVLLPLVTKNFAGGTTMFGVQNTDTANDITVNVTYTPQDGTKYAGTKTYDVKAGASVIIDLASDADLVEWIGSASIAPADGSTPVVASAMIYTANYVYAYSGFTSTGTEWYAPLIRSEFAGLSTGVQVVNATATATAVTIEYTGAIYDANFAVTVPSYTCSVSATLPGNSSITFYNAGAWPLNNVLGATDGAIVGGDCQTNGDATFGDAGLFLGSAKITSAGDVAVVVNDANASGTSSGAYSAFQTADASGDIASPLARVAFAGLTSGTQVQNICATDVTVNGTYQTSPLSQNNTAPTVGPQTIPAGGSYTFYVNPDANTSGWLGSLGVTTTGGNCLVGITNDAPVGDASVFNTVAIR